MVDDRKKSNRLLIAIALLGILIELTAIVLLATRRVEVPVAVPLMIAGMFLAFVPIFTVARRAKR